MVARVLYGDHEEVWGTRYNVGLIAVCCPGAQTCKAAQTGSAPWCRTARPGHGERCSDQGVAARDQPDATSWPAMAWRPRRQPWPQASRCCTCRATLKQDMVLHRLCQHGLGAGVRREATAKQVEGALAVLLDDLGIRRELRH